MGASVGLFLYFVGVVIVCSDGRLGLRGVGDVMSSVDRLVVGGFLTFGIGTVFFGTVRRGRAVAVFWEVHAFGRCYVVVSVRQQCVLFFFWANLI